MKIFNPNLSNNNIRYAQLCASRNAQVCVRSLCSYAHKQKNILNPDKNVWILNGPVFEWVGLKHTHS